MSSRYILAFVIVLSGSFSLAIGQERTPEISTLLEQLKNDQFSTRKKAVDQLAEKGELAIVPVIQLMKGNKQSLETVARCGQVLVEITENIKPDTKASKILIAEIDKLLNTKDPNLVGIAERLKSLLVPSIESVQEMLRNAGCHLESRDGLTRIELDKRFNGTPEMLRNAHVFEDKIKVRIDVTFDLEYFKALPFLNLKHLVVPSSSLAPVDRRKDQIDEKLREIAKCTGLQTLRLFFNGCPNKELSILRKLPELTELQLPGSTTDEELKIVADLIHLQRLEIVNCKSVKGYGYSFLKKNKTLRSLNLFTCIGEDKTLKSLGELTQLTNLSLPQHSNNSTLKSIAGLTNLRYLSISNTAVTDEGIKHLKALHNLDYLVLGETPLTYRSIPRINAIPNLSRIYITHTLITAEEAKRLPIATKNSKFPFAPEGNEQMQTLLDLVQSGVTVKVSTSEPGKFDVRLDSAIVEDRFSGFSKIAKLKIQSLNIDYPLSPSQAQQLCKLHQNTNVRLQGSNLSDEVAELLHEHFLYVVDFRNGKKRITDKWEK